MLNAMKHIFPLLIVISLAACIDSNKKDTFEKKEKEILKVAKLDSQTKEPESSIKKPKVKNEFSDEQYQSVIERFNIKDSIELLKFYEEDFEDFKSYEYVFRFSKFNSIYHGRLNHWTTFSAEQELKYAGYKPPHNWNKTASAIQTELREISQILTEWVRIEYYQDDLTLNNWAPRYYCFTDTVIYDNTFQDGPYIYRYISIDKTETNKITLSIEDVQSEGNSTIDIYFLSKDLILMEQSNKYLDGSSDCALYISRKSINQYPLIAIESSEEPIGVNFTSADCESIKIQAKSTKQKYNK